MKKFEHELEAMEKRIVEMAELTRTMVNLGVDGIKDRSRDISEDVQRVETQVNTMQTEIDQEAVRMMTVYGPVASNLRYLLCCTHVTANLERIGDQVVNICESLRMITADPQSHSLLASVRKMADQVAAMVDDALDAYFSRDAEKAQTTRTHDDMVDALNDQIVKELLTDEVLRNVLSGARNIADAVAQVLLARHLERMADQATNICKEVVYMVRGDYVRHLRLKNTPPDEPAE